MAKTTEMVEVALSSLKPYERNAKLHPTEQIERLKESIREFGFISPCLIDSENNIIAGHGRVEAAKALGMESVPCVYVEGLTDAQRRAYILADNRLTELGGWDMDIVFDELNELDSLGFDVELTGFEMPEEVTEVIEDDFDEDSVPEEPRCNLGDLWQLGDHRLICGDSTDASVIDKLMDGQKADMVFTDPPYLMGFEGNVHGDGSKSFNAKFGSIKNDKMSRKDGDDFILGIFNIIKNYCIGSYYVCFYRLGLDYIFRALDRLNNKYKALIIWDKGNHTLSNSDYMSKYEPIVYGWFNEHNFYGDRSNFDIWNVPRTKKNDLHPTMKPVELVAKAVLNSSNTNNIVLDAFGGSGSTLIACEQLNRKCFMCELDPHYCDVIIDRWEQYTGKKAVRVDA